MSNSWASVGLAFVQKWYAFMTEGVWLNFSAVAGPNLAKRLAPTICA